MEINQQIKFLLSTLLGLVFPLGAVWGPFLFNAHGNSVLKAYRKKLVILEMIIYIVVFFGGSFLMVDEMESLLAGGIFDMVYILKTQLIVYPLCILAVIIIGSYVEVKRNRK